jgi:hypothetical protein
MPTFKLSHPDEVVLPTEPGSTNRELGSLRGTITAEELEALLAPLPAEVIESFYASAKDCELPTQASTRCHLGPLGLTGEPP